MIQSVVVFSAAFRGAAPGEQTMGFDGFDGVELIMEMEDLFGFTISDREAERLHTAGELHAYLVRLVSATASGPDDRCAGAAAFRRAQRVFTDTFGVDRRDVRPHVSIARFLPSEAAARRDAWRKLSNVLEVPLPRLEHSKRRMRVANLLGLVLCIVGIAGAAGWMSRPLSLGLVVAGILCPYLLLAATRSQALEIPTGHATVGLLSSALLGPEIERIRTKKTGWTNQEVWELVRWYTAKSAGIAPAAIQRDTKFIAL
jgi:hypothetical protein